MSKILDEFNFNLHCDCCHSITEHNIQKIDEDGNAKFIGYWGRCDICENIIEVAEKDIKSN